MNRKTVNANYYSLTTTQVAKKLEYSKRRIQELACNGDLPAIKVSRLWLFNENEVREYFKDLKKKRTVNGGTGKNGAGKTIR